MHDSLGLKVHCFRHSPFEFLGHVFTWIQQKKCLLTTTDFFADELPPPELDTDLLVILGGPMGANDEHRYSWLSHEKKAIEKALRQNTKVLGICLGAQLIASVMGATIRKNPQFEIGWHLVNRNNDVIKENKMSLEYFPEESLVFQWHGEAFDIPRGGSRIFSSSLFANQGFVYGDNVVGFQFHPEIDEKGIRELLAREYADVPPGPWVQSPSVINRGLVNIDLNKRSFLKMLTSWTDCDRT